LLQRWHEVVIEMREEPYVHFAVIRRGRGRRYP
jgi:hypothetical protein